MENFLSSHLEAATDKPISESKAIAKIRSHLPLALAVILSACGGKTTEDQSFLETPIPNFQDPPEPTPTPTPTPEPEPTPAPEPTPDCIPCEDGKGCKNDFCVEECFCYKCEIDNHPYACPDELIYDCYKPEDSPYDGKAMSSGTCHFTYSPESEYQEVQTAELNAVSSYGICDCEEFIPYSETYPNGYWRLCPVESANSSDPRCICFRSLQTGEFSYCRDSL